MKKRHRPLRRCLFFLLIKMKNTLTACLAFSCGNDHSCIRNSDSDTCYDFGKGVIINSVVKGICVNIICMAETRYADRMRANTECCFQMLCMHQKSGKLITIFVKAEENTDSYVIDTAFHCTVHCSCMIIVIMFWSCRVKLEVAFFMISFLE